MALSIKDEEADRLARALASETGETITQAVIQSLRERLERQLRKRVAPSRRENLRAIRERMRQLPVIDPRSEDEILGYDTDGMPR